MFSPDWIRFISSQVVRFFFFLNITCCHRWLLLFSCSHFHFVSKMVFFPPREQMNTLLLKLTYAVFQNLEKKKECWECLLNNLREDGGGTLSGQKDPVKAHQMIRGRYSGSDSPAEGSFLLQTTSCNFTILKPLSKWLLNLPQSTLNMAMFVPSE